MKKKGKRKRLDYERITKVKPKYKKENNKEEEKR